MLLKIKKTRFDFELFVFYSVSCFFHKIVWSFFLWELGAGSWLSIVPSTCFSSHHHSIFSNNWWNFCQTMNNVTTQPRHWKFNSNQIHFDWLFISIVESDFIPLWYRSPVTGVDPNPLFWRVTNYALQICSHGQNTVSDKCLTVKCTQYTSKGLSKCTHQIVSLNTVSTQQRRFIRSVCVSVLLHCLV